MCKQFLASNSKTLLRSSFFFSRPSNVLSNRWGGLQTTYADGKLRMLTHKTCALRAPRRWLLARTLFVVSFVLPFCYALRTSRWTAKGPCEGWRMADTRWCASTTVHTFEGSCDCLVFLYYFNHTETLRHVTGLFSTHDTTYHNAASVQAHANTCLRYSQACFCKQSVRALCRKCTGGQITRGTSHFDMLEANCYAKHRRSAPATRAPLPPPPPPDDSDADADDALCDCAMRLRGGGDQNVSTTTFSFFKQIPFHLERFFYKKEQAFHKWHHWWTSEHWWERLPGRTWNPVTLWWRIKQNG